MTVVVVVEVIYLHNPMIIIGKKMNDVIHSDDNDELIRLSIHLSPLSQFLQLL